MRQNKQTLSTHMIWCGSESLLLLLLLLHVYIDIFMCIYIYIYIYITLKEGGRERERERHTVKEREGERERETEGEPFLSPGSWPPPQLMRCWFDAINGLIVGRAINCLVNSFKTYNVCIIV